jgi:hypothetical protein
MLATVTESKPEHVTSTGEPEQKPTAPAEPPASKENEPPKPNGTAIDAPAAAAEQHKDAPNPPQLNTQVSDADKIAVATENQDLPPIKKSPAAPGMSATSGPLEDFPEGDFHE